MISRVFVSAGHFPQRPGSVWRGFCEHDEAARWAGLIVNLMNDSAPASAVLVPTGTLRDKTEFIRPRCQPGDVAAEIHFGEPIENARGCYVAHAPDDEEGEQLAESCLRAVSKHFAPSLGTRVAWYVRSGVESVHMFVDKSECPAVLVVPQFLQHSNEIARKMESCCSDLSEELLEFVR